MTHQEHSKMCEVITETTGLIWRNTLGFTAAAVPTTPPTWHTHTPAKIHPHMHTNTNLLINRCTASKVLKALLNLGVWSYSQSTKSNNKEFLTHHSYKNPKTCIVLCPVAVNIEKWNDIRVPYTFISLTNWTALVCHLCMNLMTEGHHYSIFQVHDFAVIDAGRYYIWVQRPVALRIVYVQVLFKIKWPAHQQPD